MTLRITLIATFAAVLASVALAQDARIDTRVERNQATRGRQDGRMLDANPSVYGGRTNAAVPSGLPRDTSIGSISRSRGLSGFSGNLPTLNNELGLSVHTNGVDRFRQQSVGVQDAVRGGPGLYRPQTETYYSPLTTTLKPSDITQANEVRQVPMPSRVSEVQNVANKMYVDAMADYKPFTGQRQTQLPYQSLGLGTEAQQNQTTKALQRAEGLGLASQGGQELFGMLQEDDRARLARELHALNQGDDPGLFEPTTETDPNDRRVQARVEGRLGEPVGRNLGQPIGQPDQADPLAAASQPGQESSDTYAPGRGVEPFSLTAKPPSQTRRIGEQEIPPQNQDVFMDLLVGFRQRQQQGDSTDATAQPDETTQEGDDQAVEVQGPQIIVHNLAGAGQDPFNRFMRRGRALMQQGRYYQALRQYELASMTRSQNPLGYLGESLASFMAGEWFNSSAQLRRALTMFPPLIETKLDIANLIPPKEFDARLKNLDKWIASVPNQPSLLFLSAWLSFNAGDQKVAADKARELLKRDDIDKFIRTFSEYIVTGKKPTEMMNQKKTDKTVDKIIAP